MNPVNTFTYFRKSVFLGFVPKDATMHFAADSNAHVWVNGHIVQRKMTRYFEGAIRTEAIDPRQYLHPGWNAVVVLHHNWGPIVTFQRSGNAHAGLYLRSRWINSNATWRYLPAPEFAPSPEQIVGFIGDRRIRYPQVLQGAAIPESKMWQPAYNDRAWQPASVVIAGPWPSTPLDVETAPLAESSVMPERVVAAGHVDQATVADRPIDIAGTISRGLYIPEVESAVAARRILHGGDVDIRGKAGETKYVMVDFGRPIHGFPALSIAGSTTGCAIDFGYGELSYSQYSGNPQVRATGWIDPERVVGKGYADRYVTVSGRQAIELPDERTARWMSLLIHFESEGFVRLSSIGFVQSGARIDRVGTFSSGDAEIDRILQLAMIHARITMSDVLVDTPGREDGMWIEDARPRAELAARWFGDDRLRRLLLRLVAESQHSNGNFHPFPPANYPIDPYSMYDWTIEWTGALYDQYEWSGEAGDVSPYWEMLQKFWTLVLARMNADGIWRSDKVLADLRIGEHPRDAQESSSIVTAQLISRLREAIVVARATGHHDAAASWEQARAILEVAFKRYHRVEAKGDVPAHIPDVISGPSADLTQRGYSQAAQVMAALAGLMPPDMLRADLDYAFGRDGTPANGVARWNNPTYAYRALRTLTDAGKADFAVRHLRERYSPYLAGNPRNRVGPALQGTLGGPLPEYFISREDLHLKPGEVDTAQPEDETGSHGWNAVPLLWAHDSLLGVRIGTPGGGELLIAPHDGGLPFAKGTTYTPRGEVFVDWQPAREDLTLHVPMGVRFTLTLPGTIKVADFLLLPRGCVVVDSKTLHCDGTLHRYRFAKAR